MGDFQKGPTMTSTDKPATNRVSIIAALMTVLAFLAPAAIAGYIYGFDFFLSFTAVLWTMSIDAFGITFYFNGPFNLIMMIPFLLFRVASAYLIIRYYQEKTTKGRARIAAVLGDAPFLFIYGIWLITIGFSIGIGLNFPLPIMMIVGLILLWIFPVKDVTVPWEGTEDPKSWWEEKPEETTESPADDQPW
jgi:hypothetical protein